MYRGENTDQHQRQVDNGRDWARMFRGLRQEMDIREGEHKATVASLKQQERNMKDRAEEGEAALMISRAKLPELLDKAGHADQLINTLFTRDATIKNLSTMLEQATLACSPQPQLIQAALHGQAAQHDLVIQGYAGHIRRLEAQMEQQTLDRQTQMFHDRDTIDSLWGQVEAVNARFEAELKVVSILQLDLKTATEMVE